MGLYRFLRKPINSPDLIMRLQVGFSATPRPFHGSIYVYSISKRVYLNVPGFTDFHSPFTTHTFPFLLFRRVRLCSINFLLQILFSHQLIPVSIDILLSAETEEEMSNVYAKQVFLIMFLIPAGAASSRTLCPHLLLLHSQHHQWLLLQKCLWFSI